MVLQMALKPTYILSYMLILFDYGLVLYYTNMHQHFWIKFRKDLAKYLPCFKYFITESERRGFHSFVLSIFNTLNLQWSAEYCQCKLLVYCIPSLF